MTVYEPDTRICSVCGGEVWQGYIEADGYRYFCSDECLHTVYTDEEWEKVYEEDNEEGSGFLTGSCYTEWWDEYDSKYFDDESGKLLKHLYIADKLLDELSLSHTNTAMCYMNNGRVIEIADHCDEVENPAKHMLLSLCLLCSEKEWDKPHSKYRRNYSPVIEIVEFGIYDNVADIVERLMKINDGTPLDEQ